MGATARPFEEKFSLPLPLPPLQRFFVEKEGIAADQGEPLPNILWEEGMPVKRKFLSCGLALLLCSVYGNLGALAGACLLYTSRCV